jgi:8-oxo-dGTP pyrophosphatase MutT (NUDIX family)
VSDLLPPGAIAVREQLERLRLLPNPRPVAGGVVVNRQGQLLLVYASFAQQGWHFPKGGLDEGETALRAAVKETGEEGGVEVEELSAGDFDLGPGGTFTQSLGFGSPRVQAGEIYNPVCVHFGREVAVTQGAHRGEEMSVAALELLRRACREAGVAEEEFFERRYTFFDAWRDLETCWQQHTSYHVVPFAGYRPGLLNGESQRVAWWSVEELRRYAEQPDAEVHRHVGILLALPGVAEAMAAARGRARPA